MTMDVFWKQLYKLSHVEAFLFSLRERQSEMKLTKYLEIIYYKQIYFRSPL